MTIRNTQTGETRTIDPSQASQYGITAPSQSQTPNFGGGIGNAVHAGGDFLRNIGAGFIPDVAGAVTNLPNEASFVSNKLQGKKNALQEYTKNYQNNPLANQEMIKNASSGNATGVGLGLAGDALSGAGLLFGGGMLKSGGKFALNPSRTVGKALENKVAQAGSPSEDLLTKYLGTARDPNPKLYQKVGLTDSEPLLQARRIVTNVLSGNNKNNIAGGPTFADILGKRTGAYGIAQKSFLQPASQEQRLAKNFAKAYTDIIHEGVPKAKRLDATLSLFHKTNNPWLKYGLGGLASEQLMSHLGKGIQSLFSSD